MAPTALEVKNNSKYDIITLSDDEDVVAVLDNNSKKQSLKIETTGIESAAKKQCKKEGDDIVYIERIEATPKTTPSKPVILQDHCSQMRDRGLLAEPAQLKKAIKKQHVVITLDSDEELDEEVEQASKDVVAQDAKEQDTMEEVTTEFVYLADADFDVVHQEEVWESEQQDPVEEIATEFVYLADADFDVVHQEEVWESEQQDPVEEIASEILYLADADFDVVHQEEV